MEIEDVLKEHGIEYREVGEHHHVTAGWINTDCPDCSPNSGRFRLGWNLRGKYFSCWLCGKMPTIKTLRELTSLRYDEARRLYKELEGEVLGYEPPKRGKLVYPMGVGPLFDPHKNYLRGRGFVPEEIERKWHIKGTCHLSEIPWSIFIPIEADGDIVSWTSRAIGSVTQRYTTAKAEQEKVSAKTILYGMDHCDHACIVVEGPTDAWRIGYGAVALMGTEYTRAQLLAISKFPVRYICLDPTPGAQRVAKKLCSELSMLGGRDYKTVNVKLDTGEDPGSAEEWEIRNLRRLLK